MQIIDTIKSNKIIHSSAVLVLITLGVKALGYIEKLILAYYWGTGNDMDVYILITTFIISIFLFFREIVEPGYLNIFLRVKKNEGEKEAWSLFRSVFSIILVVTVVLYAIFFFYPEQVIKLIAPGFDIENRAFTAKFLRIGGFASIFLALSTLTYITLNAYKRFAIAAAGDLVQKLFIILTVVVLFPRFGIYSALVAVVVGGLARLLVHLSGMFRYPVYSMKQNYSKEKLKPVWILTWPILVGVLFSQVSSLTDNIFASYLPSGTISALSYSRKLVELPVVLFPYAFSVVIFPYLSQYIIENKETKVCTTIIESIKWIIIIFLPLSIFFSILSPYLVEIVFQRGAFDVSSTLLTAKPMTVYSIGMLFFALETVIVIFYFAFADTKTPIFIGIVCSIFNIFLTFILIKPFGYLGIAASQVISKIIKVAILSVLLNRKVELKPSDFYRLIFRLLPGLIIFILGIVTLFLHLENSGTAIGIYYKLLYIVIGFFFSALFYILVSRKSLKLS